MFSMYFSKFNPDAKTARVIVILIYFITMVVLGGMLMGGDQTFQINYHTDTTIWLQKSTSTTGNHYQWDENAYTESDCAEGELQGDHIVCNSAVKTEEDKSDVDHFALATGIGASYIVSAMLYAIGMCLEKFTLMDGVERRVHTIRWLDMASAYPVILIATVMLIGDTSFSTSLLLGTSCVAYALLGWIDDWIHGPATETVAAISSTIREKHMEQGAALIGSERPGYRMRRTGGPRNFGEGLHDQTVLYAASFGQLFIGGIVSWVLWDVYSNIHVFAHSEGTTVKEIQDEVPPELAWLYMSVAFGLLLKVLHHIIERMVCRNDCERTGVVVGPSFELEISEVVCIATQMIIRVMVAIPLIHMVYDDLGSNTYQQF